MSLSDKEKNFVNLDNPQVSPNALLAAKVFAKRAPNIDAIVRTFKPIWRTRKDFHIRAVGNQVLLFNFELDTGTDCVLLSEPWSFDRILFCSQDTLREKNGTKSINDFLFLSNVGVGIGLIVMLACTS